MKASSPMYEDCDQVETFRKNEKTERAEFFYFDSGKMRGICLK